MERRVLLSLGGNAILPGRGAGRIEDQIRVTRRTMHEVAELLEGGARVALTHGNGPIVGNILLRNERARDRVPPMPLDVCGADSQGGIGYMIQQSLLNVLRERGLENVSVCSVVTQVLVDADDPAFRRPTKPIGPYYTEREAKRLAVEKGWQLAEDSGRGMRRVVASPWPLRIVEERAIRLLFQSGSVVIAAGGGGIPVAERDGRLEGVEAVIDKDRTAVLLARAIGADTIINVTSVDRVALDFGTPQQRDLDVLEAGDARRLLAEGQFPPGSMGPKIEAALSFLEAGGNEVIIASPAGLAGALQGRAGTRIVPSSEQARVH